MMSYKKIQDFPDLDPTGWLVSEKLDGYRGYWDGKHFVTRSGKSYTPPKWYTDALPNVALDGELWAGRGNFDTCGIVRRDNWGESAKKILLVVFDAQEVKGTYKERHQAMQEIVSRAECPWLHAHTNKRVKSRKWLNAELARIEKRGGEGLVIHNPESLYVHSKVSNVLKVKSMKDDEAIVVEHYQGPKGKPGVYCDWNGTRIKVANGFNLDGGNRPPVGTQITFGYFEETSSGMPRFPVFIRTRKAA